MAATDLRVVVIGGSAGGIDALLSLLPGLPAHLQAAVFIVIHLSPHSPSKLAQVLAKASPLPIAAAVDGETIVAGHIYTASADHHLMLDGHVVRLTSAPKESRHRPAIDVLFRSAAEAFGVRVTGVVLTGMLEDGSAGLWAIKDRGGVALVQKPSTAAFPDMPRSAWRQVEVDAALAIDEMAAAIVRSVARAVDEPAVGSGTAADEPDDGAWWARFIRVFPA